MYRMSGFVENLNIQNCENSTANFVHYICMECLDLQKNLISKAVKIQWEFFTLSMYRRFGFAEKLNIWNCKNLTKNCVHYICAEWLDLKINWIFRAAKIQRKIVYVIYVQNDWICRKIEYLESQKFNGKLCILNMFGMSGFAEKLNIQSYENSTKIYVRYTCTECLDLQKNWISTTAKIQLQILYIIYVQNVWICEKVEYRKLRKYNRKLFTVYMYGRFGFA